jgi:hypothetical protein
MPKETAKSDREGSKDPVPTLPRHQGEPTAQKELENTISIQEESIHWRRPVCIQCVRRECETVTVRAVPVAATRLSWHCQAAKTFMYQCCLYDFDLDKREERENAK